LTVSLAETAGRNADPDPDGEAPLSRGDRRARVRASLVFLFRSAATIARPPRRVQPPPNGNVARWY
jgi:hypothetical protein